LFHLEKHYSENTFFITLVAMNNSSSKLPKVGTTIFTVMSKMAMDHNAINLSQGFPNFPVDERLTEILARRANDAIHQYAPMPGHPALLAEISALTYSNYGRSVSPGTELLVTAGATQAIFAAIQALGKVGEEVIILDPSYDCYEPPVVLTGAIPIRIPLQADFTPDWERIKSRISEKTRMIIVNNPHNPTGKVLDEKDILELESLLLSHPRLLLLSDEVYEYISFEKKHISINTRLALLERSVIVSSFGKTFHITGWKIGYLVAPEKLMNEIKKVHQFLVFCVNSVAQHVLADYLPLIDVKQLAAFYMGKRDFFKNLLKDSRFVLLPSEGSYFQVASYQSISDENDIDFCKRLVTEFGVAAIPLSVFNDDGRDQKLIRFCFAKDEETLKNATERLCKI
jgi:methionine aminotransferase